MSKLISLFAVLVFMNSAYSKSSLESLTEQQIKSMLCQKWKLATLEGKGKKMDVPANTPEIILHFLTNGTLQEKAGDKNYKGTWTYNHSKLTVTTVDKDGKENHTLVEITDDLLRMKTKFMGIEVIYGMKKID